MNDFCVFMGIDNILTNDKNTYLEFLFTIFSTYLLYKMWQYKM